MDVVMLIGSQFGVVLQNLGEADDGVHRGAQLVAHGREELRLGPVGQLGCFLGFCQLLPFGQFFREVREDHEQMLDDAVLILHPAIVVHGRELAAILASAGGHACPRAALAVEVIQYLERLVVFGLEVAEVAAEDFLAAVPQGAHIGVVHIDDALGRIEHADGLLGRIEDAAEQHLFVFCGLLLGNVAVDADHPQWSMLLVPFADLAASQYPLVVAVLATQPHFDRVDRQAATEMALRSPPRAVGVVRMQQAHPGVNRGGQLVRTVTQHLHVPVGEHRAACLDVPIP